MIVGYRGREHALARIMSNSGHVDSVIVAPGSAHMSDAFECLPVDISSVESLLALAKRCDVSLVLVANEKLIVRGIADHFMGNGISLFACSKESSRIESSKAFAKQVLRESDVESPRFVACSRGCDALEVLDQFAAPWVVKLDGLASGKGVVVTEDRKYAEHLLLKDHRFSSSAVILEEYVRGVEAGLSGLVHGGRVTLCWEVWDYKRLHDGDNGPLTGGGMGAVVQAPRRTAKLIPSLQRIVSAVGIESGFVNLNTIEADTGTVLATEMNIHIGTPECEALAVSQPEAIGRGILGLPARWNEKTAAGVAVTLTADGYPGQSRSVEVDLGSFGDCVVFANNASKNQSGGTSVGSGRIATVAAAGTDVHEATRTVYAGLNSAVAVRGLGWRKDIGLRQPATWMTPQKLKTYRRGRSDSKR